MQGCSIQTLTHAAAPNKQLLYNPSLKRDCFLPALTCPWRHLAPCSADLLFGFLDMVKTDNLGICAGQKAGLKPSDTEITVEGIDNSSSNPKGFTEPCAFRESNFNYVFQRG